MALKRTIHERAKFRPVVCGVLKGDPQLEMVLKEAAQSKPALILIYPLFMSDGYFVNTVLKGRVVGLKLSVPIKTLQPIGLSRRLPELLHRRSLEVAGEADFTPRTTRLLLAGHGSKIGHASSKATEKVALKLGAYRVFSRIQTAYLEEQPLLQNQLAADRGPTIVAGFFVSDGLHAYDDVPAAISETGAKAAYTGAIGTHPAIADLILEELKEFMARPL